MVDPTEGGRDEKCQALKILGERLQYLFAHDAILLRRYSLAIPKLLYTLSTSPCFLSPNLQSYDDALRSILSSITNSFLDDTAWTQASLLVRCGGLGIQSAVHLAPSAFLVSATGSVDLAHHILPPHFQHTPLSHVSEALDLWGHDLDQPPPEGSSTHRQGTWDSYKVSATSEALLESAPNPTSRARLLAASAKSLVPGSMPSLSPPWASGWTTPRSGLQSASDWACSSADLIHVTTVAPEWTVMPYMG